MNQKVALARQLGQKMQNLEVLKNSAILPSGWIKATRISLGISLQQLANKLKVSRQNMHMLEQREKEGTITLNTLKETAAAMDMQLVYGFVPKDGSIEKLIERKATELATRIVMRTSHSMKLEDQENPAEKIKKAIEEKADLFKNELPKILWD